MVIVGIRVNKAKLLFWYPAILALGLSVMELVTYSGFALKHLYISPTFLATVIWYTGGFVLLSSRQKKPVRIFSPKLTSIVLFFFSLLYVLLKFAEQVTYHNFVYSHLHMQPQNLPPIIKICTCIFIFSWLPELLIYKLMTLKNTLIFLMIILFGVNSYRIFKIEKSSIKFMFLHPLATYQEKMSEKVGDIFFNFTQFINTYTEDTSNILIPPQAYPWPQSGNGAYIRYFIYPRNVGNGEEYAAPAVDVVSRIDYVLLDWGETKATEKDFTHGWPKFDVPAEYVLIMNKDGSYSSKIEGDYRYEDYKDREVWGVIKVKH